MTKSPLFRRMNNLGLNLFKLQNLLHFHSEEICEIGLWSATECPNVTTTKKDGTSTTVDFTQLQKVLVNEMRSLSDTATRTANHSISTTSAATMENPLYIPVNVNPARANPKKSKGSSTAAKNKNDTASHSPLDRYMDGFATSQMGMVSYPNMKGAYRPLQYPYFCIWHETCRMANVTCNMVYLHRDPYSIIRSTTIHRKFNKNKITAIQLYITMLNVIYSQMLAYPDSIAGCWDYYNVLMGADDESSEEQHESVQSILGWKKNATTDYFAALPRTYKSGKPNDTEKAQIAPPEIEPFMRSMVTIHDRLCRRLYKNP